MIQAGRNCKLSSTTTAHALAAVAVMMATLVSLTLVLPVDSFSGYSSKVVPLSPVNHFFHYPFHLAASGGEEMEKFENARQEFEKLIVSSKPLHSSMTQISTQNVKPLTASTKRFMELELNLLKQLEESDDVVDPLVELWTAERADASKDLRQMELGNCSPGLVREEAQLRAMIEQYGTEWVEPMNRLAVLLFTKGRLMEAMDLIRNVLQVKPWHFEAGQLLVVMLLRMGDYNSAVKAARTYTLPNLNESTKNRRRKRWVKDNVKIAQDIFRDAVEATNTVLHPDVTYECSVDEPYCWQ